VFVYDTVVITCTGVCLVLPNCIPFESPEIPETSVPRDYVPRLLHFLGCNTTLPFRKLRPKAYPSS